MFSVLLAAVNARYNHTNPAVRLIAEYAKKNGSPFLLQSVEISIREFTISEPFLDILRDTAQPARTMVFFSVYIWNCDIVYRLITELRKIRPDIIIGAGGPEVSYHAEAVFKKCPSLDVIMQGEGEKTMLELLERFAASGLTDAQARNGFLDVFSAVPGLFINQKDGVLHTGYRPLIQDLSELPFVYTDMSALDKNLHIFYYESSRGCPFQCSYCLSSIDTAVRFMPLDRVFHDLQIFLDERVHLVKFVDRTYNLNEKRYLAIWQYILDHHNGCTMFHFEMAALRMSDEVCAFLSRVPPGVMQFEIGIQSMTEKTLQAINRSADPSVISSFFNAVPPSIHTHADLIAGLPNENIADFAKSFDFTMNLHPDMLQLGFLKILSGTQMEVYASDAPGYKWMNDAPYEVLQSSDMSFDDLVFLKKIESLVDAYYNSGNFSFVIKYLLKTPALSMFAFFTSLVSFFEEKGLFAVAHKPGSYFGFLKDFFEEPSVRAADDEITSLDFSLISELLRFDFIRRGKPGAFPQWYERRYDKDRHHAALCEYTPMRSTREEYSYSEYEEFDIDPFTLQREKTSYLFLFPRPGQQNRVVFRELSPQRTAGSDASLADKVQTAPAENSAQTARARNGVLISGVQIIRLVY